MFRNKDLSFSSQIENTIKPSISAKKLQEYYDLLVEYEQWRKWTGRWLFSLQVMFEFKDMKSEMINEIKQLFVPTQTLPAVDAMFKKIIDFYVKDIWAELDPYSEPCVRGGKLRNLLKNILFDIYEAQTGEMKNILNAIIKYKEGEFENIAKKYQTNKVHTYIGAKVPIIQSMTNDLMESYEPIGVASFTNKIKFDI